MNVSIHNISTSVDIPIYTSIEEIQVATEDDPELEMLQRYISVDGHLPGRWWN